MKHLLASSGAAALVLVLANSALAQTAGFQPIRPPVWAPGGRPVLLNPYLNLIRQGDPAANYFLGTLAESQRRQNAYIFRTDIEDLNARIRTAPEDLPRPRGPVTSGTYSLLNNTGGYFNNTSYYFPTAARPASAINRPGVYAPPPRPAGAPSRFGISPGFPPSSAPITR
jgi:hypothetical protein